MHNSSVQMHAKKISFISVYYKNYGYLTRFHLWPQQSNFIIEILVNFTHGMIISWQYVEGALKDSTPQEIQAHQGVSIHDYVSLLLKKKQIFFKINNDLSPW